MILKDESGRLETLAFCVGRGLVARFYRGSVFEEREWLLPLSSKKELLETFCECLHIVIVKRFKGGGLWN